MVKGNEPHIWGKQGINPKTALLRGGADAERIRSMCFYVEKAKKRQSQAETREVKPYRKNKQLRPRHKGDRSTRGQEGGPGRGAGRCVMGVPRTVPALLRTPRMGMEGCVRALTPPPAALPHVGSATLGKFPNSGLNFPAARCAGKGWHDNQRRGWAPPLREDYPITGWCGLSCVPQKDPLKFRPLP